MDNSFDDYFLILEVHMFASQPVIKAAYKRLCVLHHPDNGGDAGYLHKVQEAYEVLCDKLKREEYLRKWKKHNLKEDKVFHDQLNLSIYDVAFRPLKKIVNEYMFFIMNKDYEMAYTMLSDYNKKKIFKKDFLLWQRLIGEIHELLEFDCAVETFNQQDYLSMLIFDSNKVVTFKVKIMELNLLLNRVEEDYFQRDVVLENGEWKILLNDINIKNIIKKYKKIIAISKKNRKAFSKDLQVNNELFLSKSLSVADFVNNCEYEFLRYQRYQRPHNIVRIDIKSSSIRNVDYVLIEKILEKNTRNLDSYCRYSESIYLLLLPETNNNEAEIVKRKLFNIAKGYIFRNKVVELTFVSFGIDQSYQSTKEFLGKIVNVD